MRYKASVTSALAAAVLAVLAAWGSRALLAPLLGDRVPFFTFFPVIFVLAWWGGWLPTLFGMVLSCMVLAYAILAPQRSLQIALVEDQVGLAMFAAVAIAIGWLGERFHAAHRASQEAANRAIEEREQLRVTLASIGDAVIVTDEKGRITTMNAVAQALTGWRSDQASGKPMGQVLRIVDEETRHAAEDPCARVLRSGSIVGLANNTLLISRDGVERPIDDSAAPIVDASQQIRGVVVVFRDVTEKRRAEKEHRRSQRELRDLFENAALPIHSVGADGTILRANQAELDLLGYEREEYVGRHIADFYVDKRAIDDILARLSRGEIIHNYEARLRAKDGTIKEVLVTSSGLWEDGKLLHTRCFTRDITARKRAEEAMAFLANSTATLGTLTDHKSASQQAVRIAVPFFADWSVVYTIDEHGAIEHQALAHRDPEKEQRLAEMLAENPLDWNSQTSTVEALRTRRPQLIEVLSESMLECLAQSEKHRQAIRALAPQSVISVPLHIRERVIGAMSFVTEAPRSYTEQDLKFAENVASRTAIAIDNAQLFQAVQEASRQKDEFLAMLAHELRNPLAAIRYAGALGQLSPADSQPELWEIIDRQTQNLARLIDDLLDVSRIRRDKITLRKEALEASAIVHRAVASIRPLIEEKRHELTLEISDQPMPLFADATRIEQILANLLTNAAKYMPEGGHVTLRAYPEDGQAVVKVIDTGVGLPGEMLPRVFDLFTQADRTLDRSQGGLGIGLTVARKLAEMHGGTISAASDGLGRGSTFTVRLPLSEVATASQQQPTPRTQIEGRQKLRVLIVDDNRDTALTGALLLKKLGHEVETAYDGPSAVELARNFRPQAVFLDIGLPGMNGYEVVRTLRQEGLRATRIVAISGYGQPEDRRRSREAGFDDHLVKPVDQRSLESALAAADVQEPTRA